MFLFMYTSKDYVWKDTQEIDSIKLSLGRRSLWLEDQGESDLMLESCDSIPYLKINKI